MKILYLDLQVANKFQLQLELGFINQIIKLSILILICTKKKSILIFTEMMICPINVDLIIKKLGY